CAIPLPSTCPAAWRCLMRHVSLHPSSFALPLWLRPRSNGHKRMPRQNRLRPSPRSRRKICRRAMEEEGGESFDHLVGAGEQGRRHHEAKRFRSHQVDGEVEYGRMHDRQFGRGLALKYAAGITSELPIIFRQIWAIAHQASSHDAFAKVINGGNGMARRQGHELLAAANEERIDANMQRSGALLHEGRKGHIDRRWAVCLQNKKLSPNTLRGRLHFKYVRSVRW